MSANLAPAPESATVNGTTLALTHSEDLDTGSTPAADSYTLNVNDSAGPTVSSVSVGTRTVTLTLATAVTATDIVTVDYDAPASSPLQDESGLDAPDAEDFPVTNNTVAPSICLAPDLAGPDADLDRGGDRGSLRGRGNCVSVWIWADFWGTGRRYIQYQHDRHERLHRGSRERGVERVAFPRTSCVQPDEHAGGGGRCAQLTLHVCDAAFAFAAAGFSAAVHTYSWDSSGLDWSSDTSRTLYLSLPTNAFPTVLNEILDQGAPVGTVFSYQFPADTFGDTDGDTLTYTATKGDGNPLPLWLDFDDASRTFSGTPADADIGTVTVKVTASDGRGGTVSAEFDVAIAGTAVWSTTMTVEVHTSGGGEKS